MGIYRLSALLLVASTVCVATIGAAVLADENATDRSGRQISGFVLDDEQRPLAGAKVRAWFKGDEATALTDERGGFSFEAPLGLTYFMLVAESSDRELQSFYHAENQPNDGMSSAPIRLTLEPAVKFQVEVVDAAGNKLADTAVIASVRVAKIDGGRTDAKGALTVRLPRNAPPRVAGFSIAAYAVDLGFDYYHLRTEDLPSALTGKSADEPLPVSLVLDGAKPVRVRVVDESAKPIARVKVGAWYIEKAGKKVGCNISGVSKLQATTDAEGWATLAWMPASLSRATYIQAADQNYHAPERAAYDPVTERSEITLRLVKRVAASGRLLFPDGRPASGMRVRIAGDGANFDACHLTVETGADGRFSASVHSDEVYLLAVENDEWTAVSSGHISKRGKPLEFGEIKLAPAVRVFGSATIGPRKKPHADQRVALWIYPEEEMYAWDGPDGKRISGSSQIILWDTTDELGRYSFSCAPGRHALRVGMTSPAHSFEIGDERELEIELNSPRAEKIPLKVVVTHEGKPVSKAHVANTSAGGAFVEHFKGETDHEGRLVEERATERMAVLAWTDDEKLRGMAILDEDQAEVSIALAPAAKVFGRLIDERTGKPIAKRRMVFGMQNGMSVTYAPGFGGVAATDGEGRFEIDVLTVGANYEFAPLDDSGQFKLTLPLVTPALAEPVDLGDVKYSPAMPERREAMARVTSAFASPKPLGERFDLMMRDARLGSLQALVVFADPKHPLTTEFYRVHYSDENLLRALADYRTLAVDVTRDDQRDAIEMLAKRLDIASERVTMESSGAPIIVLLDAKGARAATIELSEFAEESALDVKRLAKLVHEHAAPLPDAERLLAEALEVAKRDGKLVFLQETGTYCGPCFLLSRFYDDYKAIMERSFVLLKIDSYRFENGEKVMSRFRAKGKGIPWMAILDADERIVATSDAPKGNIGFPMHPEEIDHFIAMMRSGAPMLADDELNAMKEELTKRNASR